MAEQNNYNRPSQSSLSQVFINFSFGVEPLFKGAFSFLFSTLFIENIHALYLVSVFYITRYITSGH